jgi:transposase-like protein
MSLNFNSLVDLEKYFQDEQACIDFFAQARWGSTPKSPFDTFSKVYRCKGGRFKCSKTNKYFTVKTGTIFEDSNIKMRLWFKALYLLLNHSKGISSVQLSKDLGVTQKTAWFILHRLRYALKKGFGEPLDGTLEADETYLGGKEGNRHASKRGFKPGQGSLGRAAKEDKKPIVGIIERGGRVRATYMPRPIRENIEPFIYENAKKGATIYTDEYYAYNELNFRYGHDTIKHSEKKYVRGTVHTNTIENYWSCLKRGVYGIYHQISAKHIQNYLDEFAFRHNNRKACASERIALFLNNANGKLHWQQLIQNAEKGKR